MWAWVQSLVSQGTEIPQAMQHSQKKKVLSWPKTLRLGIKPGKFEFKIAGTHSVCEEQDINPRAQPRRGAQPIYVNKT